MSQSDSQNQSQNNTQNYVLQTPHGGKQIAFSTAEWTEFLNSVQNQMGSYLREGTTMQKTILDKLQQTAPERASTS